MKTNSRLGVWGCLLGVLMLCSAATAQMAQTKAVIEQLGATRGICAVLGDTGGRLAVDLARHTDLLVYTQLKRPGSVQAVCRIVDAVPGLYGKRVFVAQGALDRIGLASNTANALVSVGFSSAVPEAEVLRVLRPRGKALIGKKLVTKDYPEGIDDWTHHYHGPDNNPQSADQLARAPYLTQFIAEPRYGPAPQNAVASNGRLFMAFGNVAWHEREEEWLDTLVALDAFNGTLLWKRPLTSGIMVDRSTMIATPDTLYLADDRSCKLLDAATGEVRDELTVPTDLTGGTFWKWMALDGGVLYALVGESEKLDTVAKWRRTNHGWPWNGISKGYNQALYEWGLAKTLVALDPETRKVLWRHTEPERIDSRSLCMTGGRLYLMTAPSMREETRQVTKDRQGKPLPQPRQVKQVVASFGSNLTCLDAKTGKEVWRRTRSGDKPIFDAIGPYRPGHGYIGGWKSTAYLKCTDKALYLVGPQAEWLTALSAADGRFLWKFPAKDLHIVIRDDGLYTIGAQNSNDRHTKKLDPLTGEVLESYAIRRRACTRSVGGPDGILFRASGGSVRLDIESGKAQWISPMRPSCHIGPLIAQGHLYWVPWVCDCNLQMFGAISVGPAGDFRFDQPADAGRLEKGPGQGKLTFASTSADWTTYRGDNKRTARTSATIASEVELLWTAEAKTRPTAPVAAGGLVFVAGEEGTVRALEAGTGKEKWRAHTGGAVTFPPTIAAGRAFVGSGDGWMYALDAATGERLWRFRAAPVERRMPVYGKLLSTWPVASGVLVEGGVAYFACGLMDYDGTHVYALDAATGELKWQNNTAGQLDRFSHRGVACQGELLLHAGKLYLAGGNAVSPGVFDAATGKCLNSRPNFTGTNAHRGRELQFQEGPGPKGEPGPRIRAVGQPLYSDSDHPVFSGEVRWPDPVLVAANGSVALTQQQTDSGKVWRLAAKTAGGSSLWQQPLPGEPVRWGLCLNRDGRIIVTLKSGAVVCFGAA